MYNVKNPMQNTHPGAPSIPPILVLGVGVLSASSSSIFVRFAQVDAPSLVIAAYRLLMATALLIPWLVLKHRHELLLIRRRELVLMLSAGAFLAVHFATWITSLEFTTVASSVVLVQTAPLMVAALSPITLGERLSRPLIAGLLVAMVGSALVGLSDACSWRAGLSCPELSTFLQRDAIKGDLLAVAGAAGGAGYLLIGRQVRKSQSLIPYITLTYGSASILLTVLAALAGHAATGYSGEAYLWMALLAIFPQLIGHSTYNWALRYLPAALVSISLLGEPVASTGLAALLLEEIPSPLRLVGAAMILVGIALATGFAPAND